MQVLDPTPIAVLLTLVGVLFAVGLVALFVGLTVVVQESRRDRFARHESIPAYYGRLHFAH